MACGKFLENFKNLLKTSHKFMQDYINKLKELYQTTLEFLEEDDDYNYNIQTITSFVENQKIRFN